MFTEVLPWRIALSSYADRDNTIIILKSYYNYIYTVKNGNTLSVLIDIMQTYP